MNEWWMVDVNALLHERRVIFEDNTFLRNIFLFPFKNWDKIFQRNIFHTCLNDNKTYLCVLKKVFDLACICHYVSFGPYFMVLGRFWLKTCPLQYLTTWYYSRFHTSSGSEEDNGQTDNARLQTRSRTFTQIVVRFNVTALLHFEMIIS